MGLIDPVQREALDSVMPIFRERPISPRWKLTRRDDFAKEVMFVQEVELPREPKSYALWWLTFRFSGTLAHAEFTNYVFSDIDPKYSIKDSRESYKSMGPPVRAVRQLLLLDEGFRMLEFL